jgi:hypothetical protein
MDRPARNALEHDPEEWKPVFGQDHAPTKTQSLILMKSEWKWL